MDRWARVLIFILMTRLDGRSMLSPTRLSTHFGCSITKNVKALLDSTFIPLLMLDK
jgi:hypothetical protein